MVLVPAMVLVPRAAVKQTQQPTVVKRRLPQLQTLFTLGMLQARVEQKRLKCNIFETLFVRRSRTS